MTIVSRERRRANRAYLRELADHVAAWDPVGLIGGGAPMNEYDCLLGPIAEGVRAGLAPSALAELLRDVVHGHFGIEPSDTDRFATAVTEWHRERAT